MYIKWKHRKQYWSEAVPSLSLMSLLPPALCVKEVTLDHMDYAVMAATVSRNTLMEEEIIFALSFEFQSCSFCNLSSQTFRLSF